MSNNNGFTYSNGSDHHHAAALPNGATPVDAAASAERTVPLAPAAPGVSPASVWPQDNEHDRLTRRNANGDRIPARIVFSTPIIDNVPLENTTIRGALRVIAATKPGHAD